MFIFAVLLYLAIFSVAITYKRYVIDPILAITSASSSSTSSMPMLLAFVVAEMLAISILVIVDMRYKIFSKLFKKFGILSQLSLFVFLLAGVAAIFSMLYPISKLYFSVSIPSLILALLISLLPIILYALAFMKKIAHRNALNITAVASAIAISLYIGIFLNPLFSLLLLVILSVFDFVAVFKTKHMQVLGSSMMRVGLPAFIVVGDIKKMLLAKRKTKKRYAAVLGLGDIIIPSAYLCACVFIGSAFVGMLGLMGVVYGLYANLWLLGSGRFRALPALPLICIGILVVTFGYFALGAFGL